jgi:hypothetical protein
MDRDNPLTDETENTDKDPFGTPPSTITPAILEDVKPFEAPAVIQTAPLPQSPAPEQPKPQSSSPGVIVLQWLTYAFWGWLILALIWLVGVVASAAIADADVDGMIPYAIAATLVLLPIAFVTDLFYRRYEPVKKTGAATVIMVIHVVIFALLGIGALILTVFTVLSMFIGTGGTSDTQTVATVTELFAAVMYAAAFLRTLNPFKTRKVAKIYGFAMLGVAIVVLALGVFGPMVKAISERDDRRIETNLPLVKSGIDSYVEDNNKLPDSLKDVTYKSDDARSLVNDGLVRYEKVATPKVTDDSGLSSDDYSSRIMNYETEYRYKLCVTYTGSSNDSYDDYNYSSRRDDYQDYLSVYSHPSGEVCYKLSTTAYASSIIN